MPKRAFKLGLISQITRVCADSCSTPPTRPGEGLRVGRRVVMNGWGIAIATLGAAQDQGCSVFILVGGTVGRCKL